MKPCSTLSPRIRAQRGRRKVSVFSKGPHQFSQPPDQKIQHPTIANIFVLHHHIDKGSNCPLTGFEGLLLRTNNMVPKALNRRRTLKKIAVPSFISYTSAKKSCSSPCPRLNCMWCYSRCNKMDCRFTLQETDICSQGRGYRLL